MTVAIINNNTNGDSQPTMILRRNRPGTKRKDLYNWIHQQSNDSQHGINNNNTNNMNNNTNSGFDSVDSSSSSRTSSSQSLNDDTSSNFAVQEMIQTQIRLNPSKVKKILELSQNTTILNNNNNNDVNNNNNNNHSGNNNSLNIDEQAWIYEHMRQFLLELNGFILAHKQVCTHETQPEMKITGAKSGEDLVFLCSAFTPPQQVSAIDYMVHTVLQSSQILNNLKLFPNRISISEKGMKEIKTMTRRIYRIFAFSYFVHPEQFFKYESKTHLCERYTKFLKMFSLMQKKQFLIPDQAFKKK